LVHVAGPCIGIGGSVQAIRLGIQYCPHGVSTRVTQSFLILQVFNGERNVYLRIKAVDGVHTQMRPESPIDNLILVGWILPVITFTCTASLENFITGVVSWPDRSVRVSLRQAWILRELLQTEFRTELYLLTGDELRVLRVETDKPTDGEGNGGGDGEGGESPTDYSPNQSQILQPTSETQCQPTPGRSLSPTSRFFLPNTVVATRFTPLGGGDNIEMQPVYATVHAKPSKIYPRL